MGCPKISGSRELIALAIPGTASVIEQAPQRRKLRRSSDGDLSAPFSRCCETAPFTGFVEASFDMSG
jgi:hypothetical protein